MRRRRFLGLAGGSALAVSGGVAVDNVLLGYGTLTGTNLQDQDLESKLNERLGPVDGRSLDVDGTAVTLDDHELRVGDESLPWSASRDEVEAVEDDHGLPDGALVELVADVPALRNRDHDVEAVAADRFFDLAAESVGDGVARPYTIGALRGPRVRDVSPDLVERFVGAAPTDPEAVADDLVDAFREHTFYDAPRYVAGSIEDNVLLGTVDLRKPFDSPTGFEALLDGENHGFFCYDFAYRSIEAFHAVPAPAQTVPVVGAYVVDSRHKHVYTGLATVTRDAERDRPTLLVTFLDYTPTTAGHSFGVTAVVGDDPDGYTGRHRATDVYWNHRTYT
jgi:hypothetical protein